MRSFKPCVFYRIIVHGVSVMAYVRFLNNPLGKSVGDCVVRAISAATGLSWDEVFWGLCECAYAQGDMPSSNAVWSEYLRKHRFKRYSLPNQCPDCYTVGDFAADYPHGTYVLGTGSHAVAVIDGNVLDAWDSRNEVPIYYFRKE